MITLSLMAYILISLGIAWYKYADIDDDDLYYWRNKRRSLIFGFLFLPVLISSVYFFCVVVYGGFKIIAYIVGWIYYNMP